VNALIVRFIKSCMYKQLLKIAILFLFFVPSFAYALVHTYTCDDFAYEGGASCTDDVITSSGAGNAYDDGSPRNFDLSQANDWYASFVFEGTSFDLECVSGTCSDTTYNTPGTYTDEPFTYTSGSDTGIYIHGLLDGSVSELCITDEIGGCGSAPTPSSTVASTTIVDNPAQNIYNGMVLFLGFLWFTVWFFSKKR